ncbi:MAG: J domain-containing protein [Chloroflexota bacterium]
MAEKDYYQILGVKKNASEKEIKQAYRRLARQHHPDVNPGNKASEATFKGINAAYEVLCDGEKRKKYDQFGDKWEHADQFAQAQRGGPTWRYETRQGSPAFDIEDLWGDQGDEGGVFERLFRRAGPGTGFRKTRRRGEDMEHPIEVTLEEAYNGSSRVIQMQAEEPCADCGATGVQGNRVCPKCRGARVSLKTRRLEVKIPPGVKDGSRVRVAGEGRPGIGGGPKGDLYLIVSVKSHPGFERKGDDLHVEVSVPLTDAMLGGEVQVPTLKGRLALKIPPETQNGRVFRLAGQGMPKLGGSAKGDLYAKVKVVLPTGLGSREKALFEELRALKAGSS